MQMTLFIKTYFDDDIVISKIIQIIYIHFAKLPYWMYDVINANH